MPRAILFDLDDTLIDHESAASAAVVEWSAEHGITAPDIARRWATISERHYARYQSREITFTQQRRERVRGFLEIDVDDERADEIFDGYVKRYVAGWRTFDDAVPALRRARAAGLIVAILTNGDEDQQRAKINQLALTAEVDVLIASSVLPAGKPDPRAFLHAAARLDVAPPDTLMVGDSLEKDVLGALAVGMSAVLLDRRDAHRGTEVPRVRTLAELELSPGPRF